MDEKNQVPRASRDPNIACSTKCFAYVKANLSNAIERSNAALRASLAIDIGYPSKSKQARAVISSAPAKPSGLERLRGLELFDLSWLF